ALDGLLQTRGQLGVALAELPRRVLRLEVVAEQTVHIALQATQDVADLLATAVELARHRFHLTVRSLEIRHRHSLRRGPGPTRCLNANPSALRCTWGPFPMLAPSRRYGARRRTASATASSSASSSMRSNRSIIGCCMTASATKS